MVYGGRTQSFVSSYHTSRRAASVPVAPIQQSQVFSNSNFGDSVDVYIQPTIRTKTYSVAPRSYLDADAYAASQTHDKQFLRDITARLPTIGLETRLPPAPIILDPNISRISYSSSSMPPAASTFRSAHHHHRTPSVDFKRRTYAHSPLAHRRSDEMESEVKAFLESTPESRHASFHPSFSAYTRSRSSPPKTLSSSYHYRHHQTPVFHPPPPTFLPSYYQQYQYRPTGTDSSGWTTYKTSSSDIPASHVTSHHITSQISSTPSSYIQISNSPALHAAFDSSVYRPSVDYYTPGAHVRSVSLHARPLSYASAVHYTPTPASDRISVDYSLANKPAPLLSQYASGYLTQNGPTTLPSSYSSYTPSTKSRYDPKSYDLPKSSANSSSRSKALTSDAPRPKANYKDVKAPMSDTRRKVRDLICKTRRDPSYYE